jgi:hypothetical protein
MWSSLIPRRGARRGRGCVSPVELAKRSACHRALRDTIGRQLRAEYDTSSPLPDQLLGLLHQLQQGEEKPFVLPAAPAEANRALVGVIADADKIHSCMASLLSYLSDNRAMLEEAIAAARATLQRSRRCRNMRQSSSGVGLSWS